MYKKILFSLFILSSNVFSQDQISVDAEKNLIVTQEYRDEQLFTTQYLEKILNGVPVYRTRTERLLRNIGRKFSFYGQSAYEVFSFYKEIFGEDYFSTSTTKNKTEIRFVNNFLSCTKTYLGASITYDCKFGIDKTGRALMINLPEEYCAQCNSIRDVYTIKGVSPGTTKTNRIVNNSKEEVIALRFFSDPAKDMFKFLRKHENTFTAYSDGTLVYILDDISCKSQLKGYSCWVEFNKYGTLGKVEGKPRY